MAIEQKLFWIFFILRAQIAFCESYSEVNNDELVFAHVVSV